MNDSETVLNLENFHLVKHFDYLDLDKKSVIEQAVGLMQFVIELFFESFEGF